MMDYYSEGIERSTWICEECGCEILHQELWRRIGAQCHILPKKKFPSVRNVIDNRLHLCLAHHADYDSSWTKASTMKIWPLALQRFALFENLIEETTKIPEIFYATGKH